MVDEHAEALSSERPHFISRRLLEALGGTKVRIADYELADKGAYLWGVKDRQKGEGIFRHSLLSSRVAYFLAKTLKERRIKGFENINLQYVIEGAILHDIGKLYGEDREKLPPQMKEALGLPVTFREESPEVDKISASWLQNLGFPPEVYEAIVSHNFPQGVVDNPYWKIILLADYMVGQRVMAVEERLEDVRTRWINERLKKGEPPRIEPTRFKIAADNVRAVADEIFIALGTTDKEFIEKHQLNSVRSQQRWEKFLLMTAVKSTEDRARQLVKALIG